MDASEAFRTCQKLQIQVFELKGALRQERAKRQEYKARVDFLEQLIAEYAKTARRPSQDEWVQVSPRVRFGVLLRDNFKCSYCGASAEDGTELVIDHIIPRSAGGKTTLRNLKAACVVCNRGKGATLLDLEAMTRSTKAFDGSSDPRSDGAGRALDSAVLGSHPAQGEGEG